MDAEYPDLETTAVKVGLAFAAYKENVVRLVEHNLRGFTHIVASRQGLYVVDESRCKLIVHGFFFGITLLSVPGGQDIFVFESCDLPRGPTRHGRLIRLALRDGTIAEATVLATGLDNGCHQIDWIADRLVVIDTYDQQILRFAPGNPSPEILHPLPRLDGRRDGPAYVHANSVLRVGERLLLLLHNGAQHTGRRSEVAVYDLNWQPRARWQLRGTGCHGLALLEDGTLLTCGSMQGSLISPDGLLVHVSPYMTRGLAVGADSIVVGASQLVERAGRMRNSGTITFMDRDFRIRTVLDVPGAPTEVRRLDGQDAGLSSFLGGVPWGSNLKEGTPA